jgi:hypothetical protein
MYALCRGYGFAQSSMSDQGGGKRRLAIESSLWSLNLSARGQFELLQPMQVRGNAHQTGKEQTQDRRTEKRLHYPRRFLEDRESIAVASTTEKEQRKGRRQNGQASSKVHVTPASRRGAA